MKIKAHRHSEHQFNIPIIRVFTSNVRFIVVAGSIAIFCMSDLCRIVLLQRHLNQQ